MGFRLTPTSAGKRRQKTAAGTSVPSFVPEICYRSELGNYAEQSASVG